MFFKISEPTFSHHKRLLNKFMTNIVRKISPSFDQS